MASTVAPKRESYQELKKDRGREPEHEHVRRETSLAWRNALTLVSAFGATFVVAVAIRFFLPRFLGPVSYGKLQFAEAFATIFFVLLSLGADTYISKEVAKRPAHASDFLGSLLALRVALAGLLLLAMCATLTLLGRDERDWQLAAIFGVWQLALACNNTFAALLNANGTVGMLAITNVVAKIAWAGSIVCAVLMGGRLTPIAMCFALCEVGKALVLFVLVRRAMEVRLRLQWTGAVAVLLSSLPFFLNQLAHKIYAKVDVNMLSVLASDRQVGCYAAAANVAGLILLFVPILNAVVQPMASRIAHNASTEAMNAVLATSMRLSLLACVPVTLILVLHAPHIVSTLFGADFAPAAPMLQVLALTFPLTYVCIISAVNLVQLEKSWTVTRISLLGLLVNPLLNVAFIRFCAARWGEAFAGVGAATATVLSESLSTALFIVALGAPSARRPLLTTAGKLAIIVGLVAALHASISLPWPLLGAIELGLYGILAAAFGLIPARTTLRALLPRRPPCST